MKRIGIWAVAGVFLSFALSLWLGPRMVTWWFTPPGNTGAFTCQPQIQEATNYLVRGQLIFAATLGVLGAIGAMLRSKKPVAPGKDDIKPAEQPIEPK